ncbi:MAG: LysE family transporter [Patescibacteria group bacterium]
MKNSFKIFTNGLTTGLFLQLAIGPVFFFIINLALQKTIYDGLIAVLAVTLVDYFYITLSVVGIGKVLENKKTKNVFGIVSSIVLIIFGIVILKGVLGGGLSTVVEIDSKNLISSFMSAFILTISNPMTILFFTGIFTAKVVEYNYTKKNLYIFGFSVGLATMIFMGISVILFSLLKETIPTTLIQILNVIVGVVLIGYGTLRMIKILKLKNQIYKK